MIFNKKNRKLYFNLRPNYYLDTKSFSVKEGKPQEIFKPYLLEQGLIPEETISSKSLEEIDNLDEFQRP